MRMTTTTMITMSTSDPPVRRLSFPGLSASSHAVRSAAIGTSVRSLLIPDLHDRRSVLASGTRVASPRTPNGRLSSPVDRLERVRMASHSVSTRAVARARALIDAHEYVVESTWGDVQPGAEDESAYLESHSWDDYSEWFLGLTEGATDETKARFGFVYGDFRRLHR